MQHQAIINWYLFNSYDCQNFGQTEDFHYGILEGLNITIDTNQTLGSVGIWMAYLERCNLNVATDDNLALHTFTLFLTSHHCAFIEIK
ncbi:hypothetical protein MIR68_003197, partial [Amoeboaphelidium protococcarum]